MVDRSWVPKFIGQMSDPLARRPSLSTAMQVTPEVWPYNVMLLTFVVLSHIRMVQSDEPLATWPHNFAINSNFPSQLTYETPDPLEPPR
eukprot:5477322-Amphidinium_carterae.1